MVVDITEQQVSDPQRFTGFTRELRRLRRDGNQRRPRGRQITDHLLVCTQGLIAERAPQASVEHQYQRPHVEKIAQIDVLPVFFLEYRQRRLVVDLQRLAAQMAIDQLL